MAPSESAIKLKVGVGAEIGIAADVPALTAASVVEFK